MAASQASDHIWLFRKTQREALSFIVVVIIVVGMAVVEVHLLKYLYFRVKIKLYFRGKYFTFYATFI